VYTREATTGNKYTFHRIIEFGVRDIPDTEEEKFAFQIIRHARSFFLMTNGGSIYPFILTSSEKSFTVFALSQEEKLAWMFDLNQQLAAVSPPKEADTDEEGLELLPFLPSLPGQTQPDILHNRAPVWIPDSKASDCQTCGVAFTVIRRRHHCR